MLGATLILFAAVCPMQAGDTNQDPTALVVELGSSRYADRESAARALERLGRPALGALRSARVARDPEVRTRAGILAHKIESALLTQPSRLRLDFQNAPLSDVARALSVQTGFRIDLYPYNLTKWRQKRVSLSEPAPVEFWKVIDRLCDLAGLQYNPSMHSSGGQSEPIFGLTDGIGRTLTPVSDDGPFRVSVLSIDYQRHLIYAPSGPGLRVPPPPRPAGLEVLPVEAPSAPRLNPVTNIQFSVELLVAAEPRLILSHVGRLQLVEAIDDLGNSLIPDGRSEMIHHAGYLGMATGPVVRVQAPLRRPDAAGTSIKKLRGFVPLTVSSRRPDPLVVPLGHAVGKSFENEAHRLTVHDIRPTPTNRNLLVQLSITSTDPDASSDQIDPDVLVDGFQRADPQHLQIEVYDTTGRLVPWFQSRTDVETSRFTLTLANQTEISQLKELRFYSLTRASVKVPFEFADIPMP
jgi:hypothetical protein